MGPSPPPLVQMARSPHSAFTLHNIVQNESSALLSKSVVQKGALPEFRFTLPWFPPRVQYWPTASESVAIARADEAPLRHDERVLGARRKGRAPHAGSRAGSDC